MRNHDAIRRLRHERRSRIDVLWTPELGARAYARLLPSVASFACGRMLGVGPRHGCRQAAADQMGDGLRRKRGGLVENAFAKIPPPYSLAPLAREREQENEGEGQSHRAHTLRATQQV